MEYDPNRQNENLETDDARARACAEGLESVYRRAAEDAERIAAEREASAQKIERLQTAYEKIKAEEPHLGENREGGRPMEKEERQRPRRRRRRRRWGFMKTVRLILAILILLAIVFLIGRFWPKLAPLFSGAQGVSIKSELPGAIEALMPDEELGYNKIDFQNAVLGQTREKSELVVMEQDVQVDSQISQALANISLFEKTKTVHSFGTGVYTVDLSKLNAEAVEVDLANKSVTVTIPRAKLAYINIDPEKTTFEDTERAFLAFGDIELTSEQHNLLETSVKETMESHLNTKALFDNADRLAKSKVFDLIAPAIAAVSGDFKVEIVQPAA